MRLISIALSLVLAGCSTGTQTMSLAISAWGVEVKPSIECTNVSFFCDPVVVTNIVCDCCKES